MSAKKGREQIWFVATLLASTFLKRSSFVAGKILLQDAFAPLILVGWRFLVAAIAALPAVYLENTGFLRALFPSSIAARDVGVIALIGLLQTAAVRRRLSEIFNVKYCRNQREQLCWSHCINASCRGRARSECQPARARRRKRQPGRTVANHGPNRLIFNNNQYLIRLWRPQATANWRSESAKPQSHWPPLPASATARRLSLQPDRFCAFRKRQRGLFIDPGNQHHVANPERGHTCLVKQSVSRRNRSPFPQQGRCSGDLKWHVDAG
jgi:hypothetical protein